MLCNIFSTGTDSYTTQDLLTTETTISKFNIHTVCWVCHTLYFSFLYWTYYFLQQKQMKTTRAMQQYCL